MDKSEIGRKGEDIVCTFLIRKGHKVLERNYRLRFGEIDVISELSGKVIFSEVKTLVQGGGYPKRGYRAEERVDTQKLKKLSRTVQQYLSDRYGEPAPEWEFWIIAVTIDLDEKTARVKVIPDTLVS